MRACFSMRWARASALAAPGGGTRPHKARLNVCFALRAPTKIKLGRHLASLALRASTAKQATRCTLPKQIAAPTAPLASTAVQEESHQQADATIALPEEPVPRRAWTPARNARRRQQANTTMEKYVCGAPTKTKWAKPRANLARPAGMETTPGSQHLPAPVFVHQEPSVSRDSRNARCATKASTAKTRRKTATTARNSRPPWAPARPRACAPHQRRTPRSATS